MIMNTLAITVTVGQNAALALSRLWAKVHLILNICRETGILHSYIFPFVSSLFRSQDICS